MSRVRHLNVYAGLVLLLVGGMQSAKIRMARDPWARSWEADRLVELGDTEKAIAAFEVILESEWDWRNHDRLAIESWVLYSLGTLYGDQERLAEAEPLFQRALAIDEKRFGSAQPHVAATVSTYVMKFWSHLAGYFIRPRRWRVEE